MANFISSSQFLSIIFLKQITPFSSKFLTSILVILVLLFLFVLNFDPDVIVLDSLTIYDEGLSAYTIEQIATTNKYYVSMYLEEGEAFNSQGHILTMNGYVVGSAGETNNITFEVIQINEWPGSSGNSCEFTVAGDVFKVFGNLSYYSNSSRPIPNAEFYLAGDSSPDISSVTDEIGNFILSGLTVGDHQLAQTKSAYSGDINNYFDNPDYIDCLIRSIKENQKKYGKYQKLIFSYHGIPKKYLLKGDPYHCFCQKTTRLIIEKMNLKEDEYLTTFQSRFGPDEWLTPYTDKTLKELPSQGIKKIHILSPGFSSDCLETLEELKVENKSNFISAGGEKYNYINCLNDNSDHLKMLSSVILNNLKGW